MPNTYFPHRTDDVDVWETDDKDRNNQPQCKQEQDVGGGVVRARFPVHRTAVQQCFINTPSRILLIFTSISQHGFAPAILWDYSCSALCLIQFPAFEYIKAFFRQHFLIIIDLLVLGLINVIKCPPNVIASYSIVAKWTIVSFFYKRFIMLILLESNHSRLFHYLSQNNIVMEISIYHIDILIANTAL